MRGKARRTPRNYRTRADHLHGQIVSNDNQASSTSRNHGALCQADNSFTSGERNRATDKLEAKESDLTLAKSRLGQSQAVGKMGSWEYDPETEKVWWSDESYRLLGYKPGEVDPDFELVLEMTHPEDRDKVRIATYEAVKNKTAYDIDHRLFRNDGVEIVIHERGEVIFDDSGVAIRMNGTVQDITDRARAVEALRDREVLLSTVLEHSYDGLVTLQPIRDEAGQIADFVYTSANDSAIVLLGKNPTDSRLLEAFPSSPEDGLFHKYIEIIETGKPIHIERQFAGMLKGDPWYRIVAVPTENGITVGFNDITEKKRAEEALNAAYGDLERRIEERTLELRTTLETLVEGVITIGAQGTIESFNRSAEAMFGYTSCEMIGQNVSVLMTTEDSDRHDQYVSEYLSTATPKIIGIGREVQGRRKNGTEFPLWLSIGEMEIDGKRKFVGTVRDISEKRDADDALRKSEGRFRAITENTTDYTMVIGADGCFTYSSPAGERFTGYAPNEVVGRSYESFVVEDDLEIISLVFVEALAKSGETIHVPHFRAKHLDGHLVDYEALVTNMMDVTGVEGIVVSVRDITERVSAETELKESESQLRTITRLSPTGIFRTDRNGRAIFVNDRWNEIMGLARNSDVAIEWLRVLHPDDREIAISDWESSVEHGVPYTGEFRVIHPNGHLAWTYSEATPERDEAGEIIGFVGFSLDITERKDAENRLRDSEERFQDYTNATADWFWEIGADGVVNFVSQGFKDYSGYEPEDFVGKPFIEGAKFFQVEAEPDDWSDFVNRTIKGESFPELVFSFVNAAGEKLYLRSGGIPVFDQDSGKILAYRGTSRDITHQKKLEQDLLVAKEQAEVANKAKSEFLSSMSHELRTPMNAILGFSQLLEQAAAGPLNDDQKAFVDEILRSGHHMLDLIGDVLDLSKIESGDFSIDLENLNPVPLVQACLNMVRASADLKKIALRTRFPKDNLPIIRIDALRFKQALLNLLSNAVKYNRPNGEVLLECVSGETGNLHLSVSDTGHGIPNEMRDKVFEPFDRLGAESSDTPGTGIGLTVTKKLIESMGGTVGFESTVGEGTTFWIEMPLASSEPEPSH